MNALAAALIVVFIVVAIAGRTRVLRPAAIAATFGALALVAEQEFVRESSRKPSIMPGYMYANQILAREVPWLAEHGVLRNSYWYNAAIDGRSLRTEGAYLFLQNCSRCHSVSGFNDIRERLRGRPPDAIHLILGNTNAMVPFMPPFAGTEDERRILASFLFDLAEGHVSPEAVRHFSIRDGGR